MERHCIRWRLYLLAAALGFGMPNLAAQTLRNASGDSSELARIAYAEELFSQGLFSQSLDRLNEIGKLGSELAKAKGQYLRGQLLIQSGNIEEAERLFDKWRGDSFLQAYLGLNIGVWYAEQNKLAEAAEWLSDTASMKFAQDEEWLTLKDRANVYLGSVYNWMGKPGLARKALEKVRLDGVDANRALLGLGWTDVARSQNKEALAPWSYLSEQPTSDPSVQESLLLVPFALGRLGAHGKASNIFSKAINVYEQEITLLKTTKKSVANGSLLKAIAQSHRSNKGEWQSNIRKALNKKFLPYFINALKKPEIEQLFQSYIDIVEMEKRVQTWAQKGRSYPSTQAKAVLKKMQPLKQAYAKKINQHLVQLLDEHITRLKDYQGTC